MSENQRRPVRMHGPGARMGGEKAKDFKGTIKKLVKYMGSYWPAFVAVLFFAIGSTVFGIIGPKISGKATTELFNGLVAKVSGTGSINFEKIGQILLLLLGLYVLSAVLSFIQGLIMTGISQKLAYRFREEICSKINRMPMKYFESRTVGEVLSRITNDVDTLGQSLNQSVTQLITSLTTMVGVLDHDAEYQPSDDPDSNCHSSDISGTDRIRSKKITEILRCTAKISRRNQRPGGRGIQRT